MPTITEFPNVPIRYTLTHEIIYDNYIANLGDGYEQRINKNTMWTHADGEGNAPLSYKGRNKFTLTFRRMPHINATSTSYANMLWAFYKARLGSFEAFYFYNPFENYTRSGTTGKYLVRFMENNLSRELYVLRMFNAGLAIIEVRA
jgi:hypothetical protein